MRVSSFAADFASSLAFRTLAFRNTFTILSITGVQVLATLEHSVSQLPQPFGGFAQVSGVKFGHNKSRPIGSRVVFAKFARGTIGTGGVVTGGFTYEDVDPTRKYNLLTSNFIAGGGDGYDFSDADFIYTLGNPETDLAVSVLGTWRTVDYRVGVSPNTDLRIVDCMAVADPFCPV